MPISPSDLSVLVGKNSTVFVVPLFNVETIVIVEAIVIDVQSVESSEMKVHSMVFDNCRHLSVKDRLRWLRRLQ
jgi:hypothetical protein